MDMTLGYILCCQSPALFLAAIVLLLCFVSRRRSHHTRAVLDLILCIVAAVCGVALYFLGMGRGHFTIKDFYLIRTSGWIGLAIVAVIAVWAGIRAFGRLNRRRTAEKAEARSENAGAFATEQTEKAAAVATAADVAQVVESAVEEKAAEPAAEVLGEEVPVEEQPASDAPAEPVSAAESK